MAKPISKKHVVFFDFDNTITTYDVLDDMLLRFSKDKRWKALEDQWRQGRIGSRECLKGQMAGIRITKTRLDEYLSKIRIDPHFKKIIKLLNSKNIKTIILSDNFAYILRHILKNNNIPELLVYSNRLNIAKDRLIPKFPFADKNCQLCAHCKMENLLSNIDNDSSIVYYIGDGLSDVCPAGYADIVFAKDYLKRYFEKNKLSHIPFKRLDGVYKYFKGRI